MKKYWYVWCEKHGHVGGVEYDSKEEAYEAADDHSQTGNNHGEIRVIEKYEKGIYGQTAYGFRSIRKLSGKSRI